MIRCHQRHIVFPLRAAILTRRRRKTMPLTNTLSLSAVRDALLELPAPYTCTSVQPLIERLKVSDGELEPYLNFSDSSYTRTLFYGGSRFEILVLCWGPGQASPIHDHAASICSMAVVQGTCTSQVYRLAESHGSQAPQSGEVAHLEATGVETLHSGEALTVIGGDIHRVGNQCSQGEDLVTIHFYLPPILSMRCFDAETGLCTIVEPNTLQPSF